MDTRYNKSFNAACWLGYRKDIRHLKLIIFDIWYNDERMWVGPNGPNLSQNATIQTFRASYQFSIIHRK